MSQDSPSHNLFSVSSDDHDTSASSSDRFFRFLDAYLLAPARIAATDWRMWAGTAIITFFIVLGAISWVSTSDWWIFEDIVIVPVATLNQAPPFTPAFVNSYVPLGTDRFGRSISKRLVHATPPVLQMAFAGAVVSTGIAVVIGTTAGYKGGRVDDILMTVTDIVMTIPALPLIIVLAAIIRPEDPFIVGMILAIDNWPGLARSLRSQVLTIRSESFVEAARVMGVGSSTVLRRDVVPQLMPYIMINGATSARAVIFESVALYFLSILPFSNYNWGVMMNNAYNAGAMSNLGRAGHWLYAPMILLIFFSLGLILFSQGMDRVFNPQLRARHAKTVGGESEDVDVMDP
ncbi:ABC transporter permease [Haladaptatus sp. DFWS20]|uniref:ABC transporter permease n=1 Tax=Haladaptatus sp. DFWS20 TaxID=3403467 RepID=UPI003EB97E72